MQQRHLGARRHTEEAEGNSLGRIACASVVHVVVAILLAVPKLEIVFLLFVREGADST